MTPTSVSKLVFEPRASLEEVKAFCNKVRGIGGGEILPDLLPSTPRSSKTCLIARNLNFDCEVRYLRHKHIDPSSGLHETRSYDDGERKWYMFVEDDALREKLANALDLPIEEGPENLATRETEKGILLPREIGRVAAAYDDWWESATGYNRKTQRDELDLRSEFAPFLEEEHVAQAIAQGVTILR